MVTVKWRGRPSFVGSSDRELWVFAMQTGKPAKPRDSYFVSLVAAAGRIVTPSAPYSVVAIVSIFLVSGRVSAYSGRKAERSRAFIASTTACARSVPPAPPRSQTPDIRPGTRLGLQAAST